MCVYILKQLSQLCECIVYEQKWLLLAAVTRIRIYIYSRLYRCVRISETKHVRLIKLQNREGGAGPGARVKVYIRTYIYRSHCCTYIILYYGFTYTALLFSSPSRPQRHPKVKLSNIIYKGLSKCVPCVLTARVYVQRDRSENCKCNIYYELSTTCVCFQRCT